MSRHTIILLGRLLTHQRRRYDLLKRRGESLSLIHIYTEVSKDDLVKTYDETLNTVKDKEVVMGTVTSMNKREVVDVYKRQGLYHRLDRLEY